MTQAGILPQKCEYAYTTGSLEGIAPLDTIAYGYTAEDWPDILTSCDGQQITSDSIGNIQTLSGTVAPWFGQIGGGTQYLLLDGRVDELLAEGALKVFGE